MHGLAIVPQGLLREAFRHPGNFGAFSPCVLVTLLGIVILLKLEQYMNSL